jgi:hypothetical protein
MYNEYVYKIDNVWRNRVTTVAMEIATVSYVCIVELRITVSSMKMPRYAQKCFMANSCRRQQYNIHRPLHKVLDIFVRF